MYTTKLTLFVALLFEYLLESQCMSWHEKENTYLTVIASADPEGVSSNPYHLPGKFKLSKSNINFKEK